MAKTEVDFKICSLFLLQRKFSVEIYVPLLSTELIWEVDAHLGTTSSSPSCIYMKSCNYLPGNASPCDMWSLSFLGQVV